MKMKKYDLLWRVAKKKWQVGRIRSEGKKNGNDAC